MSCQSERLVVEVGCGSSPLPITRLFCLSAPEKYEPIVTPLVDEYANLMSDDCFVCLDKDPSKIKEAKRYLEEVIQEYPSVKASRVTLMVGDGTKLNLIDESVDVVIFSDVFSAPHPGATPASQPYPIKVCISDKAKWKMITEALRVLKKNGTLFICIHQTPCYAFSTMNAIKDKLIKKRKLQLLRQCGQFVGRSDNWQLYHIAFRKGWRDNNLPEIIPWTEKQRNYIREYAAYWESLMY